MGKQSSKVGMLVSCVVAITAGALGSGQAYAGGLGGAEADTDILFTEGTYSFRTGFVFVSPRRGYTTLGGSATSDDDYSDNAFVPGFAIKAKISPNLSCALTYTQPFGGDATYGPETQNAEATVSLAQGFAIANPTTATKFSTNEYGSTCDLHFGAGSGNVHFIGGLFLESFNFEQDTWYGNVSLKDSSSLGYRLGLAYDIPEYAMRFQVLYRSEVKHDAEGSFHPSALAIANGISGDFSTIGEGTLPQSIKLYGQSGVAPGWLVYGSVTWTDWSVLQSLSYDVVGLTTNTMNFNYKDGYTIQAGVGHQFNDDLAGTVNVTWDQGVGTGADITTDSWTLGLGAEYKTKIGTFGLGGTASYLTGGSQTVSAGAPYDGTAKGDWAFAAGMTYLLEF